LEVDMSVVYSEYDCSPVFGWYKDCRKRLNGKTDKEKFEHWSYLFMKRAAEDVDVNISFEQCASWDTRIRAIWNYKYKRSMHYFLDAGLRDFLMESAKNIQAEYWKPESFCMDENDVVFVHFPMSDHNKSMSIHKTSKLFFKDQWYGITEGGKNKSSIFVAEDLKGIEPRLLSKTEESYDCVPCAKITLGLSLYIDAFPDVVREVDGVRHIGHYKGNRHYVRANDIVRTEAHHSVSPHFRRGHFRVLRSDKFKQARGKTIFINGVFVKGKAYDVLADDYKGGE
jgi:hypothetical protein